MPAGSDVTPQQEGERDGDRERGQRQRVKGNSLVKETVTFHISFW